MKQTFLAGTNFWTRVLLVVVLGALLAEPAAAARHSRRGGSGDTTTSATSTDTAASAGSSCQKRKARPVIGGVPATSLSEGDAYLFRPTASDPNCDRLIFQISGRPVWARFNAADGTLSGTPPVGSAGIYPDIRISVSDGRYTAGLPPFTIAVLAASAPLAGTGTPTTTTTTTTTTATPAQTTSDPAVPVASNQAPTISGSPASSVTSGQNYVFTPRATDADNDPLTFGIRNMPGWARFSTTTGQLSGTPTVTITSEFADIVVSVSDGKASASLPPFSIVVALPNRAPVISGTAPPTVTVGQSYRFLPRASDADGDELRFSIAGQPTWASFDPATGELSGTPTASAVGTFANVRISVSDGTATAALPAFSIDVQQVAMGSATLSWQPPTQRTDGSPLTNLAGYRVLYGNSPNALGNRVTVGNAGLSSYVVDNLSQGTWYFAVTAFDTAGAESDPSNIGSKNIQ